MAARCLPIFPAIRQTRLWMEWATMRIRSGAGFAATIILMGGCSGEDVPFAGRASAAEVATVEHASLAQVAPGRPAVRLDTIYIEGMPQPVQLQLVESPATFPMPFTTYVPSDFAFEGTRRGDQPEVRFSAEFGGQRNPDAFLEIAPYPTGLSLEGAEERARYAADAGAQLMSAQDSDLPWAIREWRSAARDDTGEWVSRVILGRHGERYFQLRIRYPAEYADGFGPRAAIVLREWRWKDGSPIRARAKTRSRNSRPDLGQIGSI
jgi:hypothetical protein